MYQLCYEGEKRPKVPNLPKRRTADDIAWGNSGKDAKLLGQFQRLLGRTNDKNHKILCWFSLKWRGDVFR
jgi:hypothetical protein